jgi:hypothetical protein
VENLETTTTATSLLPRAISRDGGDVLNTADLKASAGKSAESRLGTGTGGLGPVTASSAELDVDGSDAKLLAADSDVLSGQHSSVGARLITISLHLHATGDTGQGFLARQIGDVLEWKRNVSMTALTERVGDRALHTTNVSLNEA